MPDGIKADTMIQLIIQSPIFLTSIHAKQPASGKKFHRLNSGRAQFTMIEHALCPLSDSQSERGFVYNTSYRYYNNERRVQEANVSVEWPEGYSATDERFLHALLAITLDEPEETNVLHVSPYYVLKRMGIDPSSGERYRLFKAAIKRLAKSFYQNESFYDPIRGEHREVGFHFFSYSLPIDDTERAWKFYWDSQFLEFARHNSGAFQFPFQKYFQLSNAEGRLFLLLRKIFYRRTTTPWFDVRYLVVNVMGHDSKLAMKTCNQKLKKCISRLVDQGVVSLPPNITVNGLIQKKGKGEYRIQLHRGNSVDQNGKTNPEVEQSAIYNLLQSLKLDKKMINKLLRDISCELLREWADISLAARKRGIIKTTVAAYFVDNVYSAVRDGRTPPDWWRVIQKKERQQEFEDSAVNMREVIAEVAAKREQKSESMTPTFEQFCNREGVVKERSKLVRKLTAEYAQSNLPPDPRTINGMALSRLKNLYRQQYPNSKDKLQQVYDSFQWDS